MATIALLHGFAATNFTWRDVEEPLRQAGHDVVALERPYVTPSVAVCLTIKQLDSRGIDEVVLVGHSAGAEIAVHVAVAGVARVGGLVLCAPVIGGGPPAIARAFAGAPVVRNLAPKLLRLGMRVGLPFALKQTWHDRARVNADVIEGFRAPLMAPGVAESLWSMTAEHRSIEADWDALRATPTLVVTGDNDKWATSVPLPKAESLTYENCGHLPHEECSERFVADVLRFVHDAT